MGRSVIVVVLVLMFRFWGRAGRADVGVDVLQLFSPPDLSSLMSSTSLTALSDNPNMTAYSGTKRIDGLTTKYQLLSILETTDQETAALVAFELIKDYSNLSCRKATQNAAAENFSRLMRVSTCRSTELESLWIQHQKVKLLDVHLPLPKQEISLLFLPQRERRSCFEERNTHRSGLFVIFSYRAL